MIKPISLVVRDLGVLLRGETTLYPRRDIRVKTRTSRRQSKRALRKTLGAVTDIRRSEFCSLCRIVFGSNEHRVLVGDTVAHSHCHRRLRNREVAT